MAPMGSWLLTPSVVPSLPQRSHCQDWGRERRVLYLLLPASIDGLQWDGVLRVASGLESGLDIAWLCALLSEQGQEPQLAPSGILVTCIS